MGKGTQRRPPQITKEEERLRWKLALGKISFVEFEKKFKQLKKMGLIRRSGKIIK